MSNEQTWLPIATAPKDGAEIVVGWRQAGVWLARNAWYRDGAKLRAEGNPDFSEEDTGWWGYRHSVTQEMLDG